MKQKMISLDRRTDEQLKWYQSDKHFSHSLTIRMAVEEMAKRDGFVSNDPDPLLDMGESEL